jgi:hypothetical protein
MERTMMAHSQIECVMHDQLEIVVLERMLQLHVVQTNTHLKEKFTAIYAQQELNVQLIKLLTLYVPLVRLLHMEL